MAGFSNSSQKDCLNTISNAKEIRGSLDYFKLFAFIFIKTYTLFCENSSIIYYFNELFK